MIESVELPYPETLEELWIHALLLLVNVAPRLLLTISVVGVGWWAGRRDLLAEVKWLRAQLERRAS